MNFKQWLFLCSSHFPFCSSTLLTIFSISVFDKFPFSFLMTFVFTTWRSFSNGHDGNSSIRVIFERNFNLGYREGGMPSISNFLSKLFCESSFSFLYPNQNTQLIIFIGWKCLRLFNWDDCISFDGWSHDFKLLTSSSFFLTGRYLPFHIGGN